MPIFQVVHPFAMTIDGESFKDAVKIFVKLNYEMNIANLIITDQARYMKANLNYYRDSNKQKVGISLIPTMWPLPGAVAVNNATREIINPLNQWPFSPTISFDTTEYPASTYIDMSGATFPRILPIVSASGMNVIAGPSFPGAPLLGPLSPLAPLLSPVSSVVSDIWPHSAMFPTVIKYNS